MSRRTRTFGRGGILEQLYTFRLLLSLVENCRKLANKQAKIAELAAWEPVSVHFTQDFTCVMQGMMSLSHFSCRYVLEVILFSVVHVRGHKPFLSSVQFWSRIYIFLNNFLSYVTLSGPIGCVCLVKSPRFQLQSLTSTANNRRIPLQGGKNHHLEKGGLWRLWCV